MQAYQISAYIGYKHKLPSPPIVQYISIFWIPGYSYIFRLVTIYMFIRREHIDAYYPYFLQRVLHTELQSCRLHYRAETKITGI